MMRTRICPSPALPCGAWTPTAPLFPGWGRVRASTFSRSVLAPPSATPASSTAAPTLPYGPQAPPSISYYYRDSAPWATAAELPLREHDLQACPHVDLIVAGSGPAGIAVAERVAQAGFAVCVIDPNPLGKWPNNYGVWVDEFQAMGLTDCLEVVWPQARVLLDNTPAGEKRLSRPYGRVDRPKLKKKLLQRCIDNGVTFLQGSVESVTHGDGMSTVLLKGEAGVTLRGSLVLDATGHSRRLVQYDHKFDPGYQGAYGIIAEVESHPFDIDTMLFMDWRDDHTLADPQMHAANLAVPTFLYAMPFSPTRVFLEETSLVARPAINFAELKERLTARLKWLGITVTRIEEEEYCLIPMGGVLPTHPQRVLGIGGTAGMVHPSTGFMMSRVLGAAPGVADAIVDQLSRPADKASAAGISRRPGSEAEATSMAAAVWQATWPVERIRQRLFFNFGMDVLLRLNLVQIREFFAAFFGLSAFHWHGFLSARLSFTQLLGFGIALFLNASSTARSNLLVQGVPGLVLILAQLVPTLGDYYGTGKAAAAARLQARSAAPPSGAPPRGGGVGSGGAAAAPPPRGG